MDVEYVQEVSEKTDTETIQQSVFDLFGSSAEGERKDKVKYFLPPIIENSEEVRVRNVTISTIHSANGPVYEYTIHWTEPTRKTQKNWTHKYLDDLATVKSIGKLANIVHCDGPCKNEVPISSVVQYGCDHLICDGCRKSQKSAPLFDGAPGCCNSECVKIAKFNGEKVRSGKTSCASSRYSMSGPWESINVHVSVLKKVYNKVVKSHLEYEFSSQSRVSSLMRTLYTYKDLLDTSRVYYSLKKPESCQDLKPISLLDTNLRFYDLSGDEDVTDLYFIVAGNGVKL